MSEVGIAQLREKVYAALLDADGDTSIVTLGVERLLRADPRRILRAWQELLASGATFQRRDPTQIICARRLVYEALHAIGLTNDAARHLMDAARGLVDIVTEELQKYHRRDQRERRGRRSSIPRDAGRDGARCFAFQLRG